MPTAAASWLHPAHTERYKHTSHIILKMTIAGSLDASLAFVKRIVEI